LIAIEVELEYRSVSKSVSRWGPKGEPNTLIVAESEKDGFIEAIEADLVTGHVHVSYRGRARV
jgi:hypothetical protein